MNIKVAESRISGKESVVSDWSDNSWNYIVLLNDIERKRSEEMDNLMCVTPEKGFNKMGENQEISRISEVDYSYGETEEIKNLLDNKILASTASKKNIKQNFFIQQSLSNILETMEKANKLIEDVKEYSEYLEDYKL